MTGVRKFLASIGRTCVRGGPLTLGAVVFATCLPAAWAQGPIAAYSFDDGSGTTLRDSSGNGLNGTIQGATWTTGKYGGALSFNGSSSYVDLGNPTQLRLTGSATWSAWIYATGVPWDDGQIIAKSGNSGGWQLKTSPDTGPHTFGVMVGPNASTATQRFSTAARALNTWYHVAGVYNATAGTLNLYVNGVLDNGTLFGTVPASQVNSSVNVNIGRRDGGFYFQGLIDEIRVYNRALTQAEIQADMNTPLGTGTGADTQAPSTPATLTATPAGISQVNLSWPAATDNIAVTGYRVERCAGAGCSNFVELPATTTTPTYNNTGLSAGTSYSYRVRAYDAAGNLGGYSPVATAVTATPDTQAPSAPGTLSASPISGTRVDLAWGAATDNVAVTAYLVERCQGAGCAVFTQITSIAGTAYSDTGRTAGISYTYRVRATDAAANLGPYTNTATAVTPAPDTQAPTVPGTLSANPISGTRIDLTWGTATDNVAVTAYLVERCQGAGCSVFTQITSIAGTSYSDTGRTAGASYTYRVRATDAAANLGPYTNTATAVAATPDTQAPTAPGVLSANPISGTRVDLAWGSATDNVAVTAYLVERCQGAGCSGFAQITSIAGTSFSDTGRTAGISYSYRVRATDAAANLGPYTNTATAVTPAPDTQAPSTPADLATFVMSSSRIDIGWTASTDNVAVTQYSIERCQGAGCGNFAQLGTSTSPSYSDLGLAPSTSYSYRVRARDEAGNFSGYSAISTAVTAPDTQAPTVPGTLTGSAPSGTLVNLSWGASSDNVGVTAYQVQRCQNAGCSNFATVATPSTASYADTSVTAGNTYLYRVAARDAASNLSGYTNTATVVTPTVISGLVGAYSFDEGAGSTVTDSSGNNLTGTIQGATWSTSGKYGKALSFNGSSNYVDLGNPTQLRLTGSMTISAWIRATSNPFDDGQIVAKSDNNTGWQFKTSPDTGPHTFGLAITGTSGQHIQRYTTTVRSLNVWYHVAGVYDAAARTMNYYVDGVLANGTLAGTVPASQSDSSVNANIGRRTGGFYFAGLIDEVRIYNRALTQVEIQTDMNTPITPSAPDTQAPTIPGNLLSNAVTGSQIDLNWTASTDNVAVTQYLLERCAGVGCSNFTQFTTYTGTTYSDSGLTSGVSYSYRVRASDAAANLSGYSTITTAVTPAPDTTPPSIPGTLTATPVSGIQINLSWGPATDNVGVTGYRLERCQGASCGDFARIGNPTGTTYSDSALLPNTTYRYQVRAQDAAVNLGPNSNIATATTQATIPGLISAYSFNENSGTQVGDAGGSGNVGTTSGTTWATGKFASGLTFNGATSYVDLGNPASLQLTSSMTVSAWVRADSVPGDDGQIVAKSDSASGWQFKTSPDTGVHTFAIALSGPSGGHVQRYSQTVRVIGQWYYVTGVYNAAAQTLDIYVNGVLDNGVLVGTVPASQVNSAVNANIGRRTGGFYFGGVIDEIRIYNRALSVNEIQSDMATPIGTATLPTMSLSTTSLTFPVQNVGTTSAAMNVQLTNTGSLPVGIGQIASTGLHSIDFAPGGTCGTSIPVGGNCMVSVTFSPTGVGQRSASLTITDNAAGNPHTVLLSGSGAATGLSVSPRTSVLTANRTQQFNASGTVTGWSIDGIAGGNATVGTITAGGLYTAPALAGTHTVSATNGTTSATATVYIATHPGVFTHSYGNGRTGQNAAETILTPANVNATKFGKLFSYALDGQAFAAPLYVPNLTIPNKGIHNVVFVATEHNSVYAFDADGLTPDPLWKTSFLGQGVNTVPSTDTGECCDIMPELGITGTPVIDPATGTLYVVAKTKEGGNQYFQRLHALDITTGAEKFGGPRLIAPSVPGTGSGTQGGQIPFNALRQHQRPALLLNNGVVYVAFGSHGDNQPWHGWIVGYNAGTLQQVMAFNVSPNGYGGGIWMSGGGPATDASGNLYFTTGNGDFTADTGGTSYGDSVLKITPAGAIADYFTPHDEATMEALNEDLASAGPVLLLDQPGPFPHILITSGKSGTIYVVNRDNMGHFRAGNDGNIIQSLNNIFPRGVPEPGNYSAPVYFNGKVYFSPVNDKVQAFDLNNGLLSTAPTSQSTAIYPYPGGAISLSASGLTNGILWAVERTGGGVTGIGSNPGILHAYNPASLTQEYYNSTQAGSRDTLDIAAKFGMPVVVNGRVYISSINALTVYGLLP